VSLRLQGPAPYRRGVVTASGWQPPYAVAVSEPEGPPDLLYHYTGLEGLEGILRERMIWATDVRYLNDTSEVHYSRVVIGRRAADREAELSGTYGGYLAHGTAAGLGGSAMFPNTFVASFCEDGDNLTLWKTYGCSGHGFALGFCWESLRQLSQVSPYSLVPIIYDTARQDERVDHVIDEGADQYAAWGGETSDLTSAEQVLRITYALMVALWSIKHPAYADEREWRLVHMMFPLDPAPTPFFRDGRSELIPYEKAPLNAVLGGFPLKEIVLGPCALDTRLQVEACLAENGIGDVLVRDSDVPFRE
jgi:hypothetical protein